MFFYFFLNLLFLSFSAFELIDKRHDNRKILFYGSIILLFFLSWLRWETGTDWDSYIDIFSWVKKPWMCFTSGLEYGFIFILNVARGIFDNFTGVLFLLALIIYPCMAYAYPRLCRFPMVALWITFCVSFANMLFVRQNVALAMLLVALVAAYRKNFSIFILTVFLASLFHRTSWIFLIVYPIFHRCFSQKELILFTIIGIFGGIVLSKFLLSFVGGLFTGIIEAKINGYMEAGEAGNSMAYSSTFVLIKGILNRCVLLVFFFFFFKEEIRNSNALVNGLLNVYILGSILYCVLLPISISLARIAVYMDITQVFLVPYILNKQFTIGNKIALFSIFSIYYLARFYTYIGSYENEFIPFKTFFN